MSLASNETVITESSKGSVFLLIPIWNDWDSARLLLPLLDQTLAHANRFGVCVLFVDDGSSLEPDSHWLVNQNLQAIAQVEILRLRRNLGHQRAIAVGLAYLEAERNCSIVLLMDGDGEDDPRDVPRLLSECEKHDNHAIVFAERTRRSESLAFRVGYGSYLLLHRILVGPAMRIGNFSAIPYRRLRSLAAVSELWSHYAAAVVKSRQPIQLLPTARAHRLQGRSKMNFVQLAAHGLSAIAVYSEIVGARLLAASFGLVFLAALGLFLGLALKLSGLWTVPDGIASVFGALAILLCLGVMLSFLFSFIILGGRSALGFLPRRDYVHFVDHARFVTTKDAKSIS